MCIRDRKKGAAAVLATLWSVADESTALLMSEFYRLHKAHSDWTKLEALRQAQLEMLHGKLVGQGGEARGGSRRKQPVPADSVAWPVGMPAYSHPYFWAPFVLTGNWR